MLQRAWLGSSPERISRLGVGCGRSWPPTRRLSPPAEGLFEAPNDAGFIHIVGGHFHFDPIPDGQTDPAFAHLAADGGEHHVLIVQLHPKHRSGQHTRHTTFDFYMFFFHALLQCQPGLRPRHRPRRPATRAHLEGKRDPAEPGLDANPTSRLNSDSDRHRRRRRTHGVRHHRRRRRTHGVRRRRRRRDVLRGAAQC